MLFCTFSPSYISFPYPPPSIHRHFPMSSEQPDRSPRGPYKGRYHKPHSLPSPFPTRSGRAPPPPHWLPCPCLILTLLPTGLVKVLPCVTGSFFQNWFLTCILLIALMLEAAMTSEKLVNFYQTTWCYNPEDSHLRWHSWTERLLVHQWLRPWSAWWNQNYNPHILKFFLDIYTVCCVKKLKKKLTILKSTKFWRLALSSGKNIHSLWDQSDIASLHHNPSPVKTSCIGLTGKVSYYLKTYRASLQNTVDFKTFHFTLV
jgi:hypothetical protein